MDSSRAAAVAEAFALGSVVAAPVFVARGAMGQVWKVVSDAGSWACKELFEWVEAPSRPSDLDVQLAAAAAGVRLPQPVVTAGGDAVVEVEGGRYRAYEWVDLDGPLALPTTPQRSAEAGALLARLHLLPLDVRGDVDEWYTAATPASQLEVLADQACAEDRRWASAFTDVLPVVERLRSFAAAEHAPPRICHRDVDPSNLLPTAGDGPIVVLDWENAGPLAADEELASSMRTWASGAGGVREDSARAFLEAYRAAGGDAVLDPARSWSMAVCTPINFLAHMARQALADDDHREFAEGRLDELCGHGLRQLLVSIELLTPLLSRPGNIGG